MFSLRLYGSPLHPRTVKRFINDRALWYSQEIKCYFAKKLSMTRGVLIFNSILLVLIGVLFYLHFSDAKKSVPAQAKVQGTSTTQPNAGFQIAYFDMDSVTNAYHLIRDVKNELSREEEQISTELSRMEKTFRDKINGYQQQAQTMSQVQSENANRDVMQMQSTMENKKAQLDQKMKDLYMRRMQEVKTMIEEYLKAYNKDKGYSYIFGYEPGFIYYRDTVYNITNDLIAGLNAQYSSKSKKK
jgi:outer membrane protein